MKNLYQSFYGAKYVKTLLFSLICLITACKKDNVFDSASQHQINSKTQLALNNLPADRVIKPNEVPLWLTSNFPVEQMLDVQQENIQQNVINGHHVIKVPVGKDAAMFFTKEHDSLKVFHINGKVIA